VSLPEPILRDFHNIECHDAVLTWGDSKFEMDENGDPVTRWDGRTFKPHSVTGELVPDEKAQIPILIYMSPRKFDWPLTDFIIGNPPFIGASLMRGDLGDGYVDSLRSTYPRVPESADYVMYWWHQAADRVRVGKARRFGLITTNSIRQRFNRKVVQHHLEAKNPLSLTFVIPDHPWVDSVDGADVRIAMTVGAVSSQEGRLLTITSAKSGDSDQSELLFQEERGTIFADLKVGIDLTKLVELESNKGIAIKGFELGSQGFLISNDEAEVWIEEQPDSAAILKPYMNGSDLVKGVSNRFVIDFYGMEKNTVREKFPRAYHHLLNRVQPDKATNLESRTAKRWWLFRRSGEKLRNALSGLDQFIGTTRTAKHRLFQTLPKELLTESKIVAITHDDPFVLGVLSSRLHTYFSFATGAFLGVGNDPTYNHLECFNTFPFPESDSGVFQLISELALQIDNHRKRQQQLHQGLTLTDIYNVLEKLRVGEALQEREEQINEQGLVSLLSELHNELDGAVFGAYGWGDLATELVGKPGATTPYPEKPDVQAEVESELLNRLLVLNAERSIEENDGHIRWLRPDFQNPEGQAGQQFKILAGKQTTLAGSGARKKTWPKLLPDQMQAIRGAITKAEFPLSSPEIARLFKYGRKSTVEELLQTLCALGHARQLEDGSYISI